MADKFTKGESTEKGGNLPPTIADLASYINLDKATVSRALNDRPGVAARTRTRVLEAARELGYTPNIHGQQLRGWKSTTLALLVPGNEDSVALRYYGPFTLEIFPAVARRGYDLLMVSTARHQSGNIADELVRKGAVGSLLLGMRNLKVLDALHSAKASAIQLDIYSDAHPEIGYVVAENDQGIYRITRHLLDLGHQNLSFYGDPAESSAFRERHRGFSRALAEEGLVETVSSVPRREHVQYLRVLLTAGQRPTAIVARNDTRAAEAIQIARELGLKVPEDLSVTGFDDVDRVLVQALSLTTLRVDQGAMARAAVDALLDGEVGTPAQRRIPTELILRGSTGRPCV
jgi:LacI family transcriptional regulator